jgi:hypothetical protein
MYSFLTQQHNNLLKDEFWVRGRSGYGDPIPQTHLAVYGARGVIIVSYSTVRGVLYSVLYTFDLPVLYCYTVQHVSGTGNR